MFFLRLKINNVLYIFEKLKKLEIPCNSLIEYEKNVENTNSDDIKEEKRVKSINNPYLNGRKGHLIFLFPLLIKCITSKENDVKIQLKELFDEISKEMDLNKFYN